MDASVAARESARRLTELLRHEREDLIAFLVALAAFDRERLWMQLGHASLVSFLHRELRLTHASAHYRKVAARLIQDFPEVVEPLRQGRLCLPSVADLARVMTPENRAEVLPRFFHRPRPRPGGLEVRTRLPDETGRVPLRPRHFVRTVYGWPLEPWDGWS